MVWAHLSSSIRARVSPGVPPFIKRTHPGPESSECGFQDSFGPNFPPCWDLGLGSVALECVWVVACGDLAALVKTLPRMGDLESDNIANLMGDMCGRLLFMCPHLQSSSSSLSTLECS